MKETLGRSYSNLSTTLQVQSDTNRYANDTLAEKYRPTNIVCENKFNLENIAYCDVRE